MRLLTIILLFFSIFTHSQTAQVIYVQDGDTFKARINNGYQVLTIRMSAIDTPELGSKYGQYVKSYVLSRLLHKTVRLEIIGVDKYGRTLAKVYLGKVWIQEELLEKGLARHYKYFDSNQSLAQKERTAKKNKLGIWKN